MRTPKINTFFDAKNYKRGENAEFGDYVHNI